MLLKGTAKVGLKTKELVKRLEANDIAVISHRDIDELAAKALIKAKPKVILNALPSISGKYPHIGPLTLLHAGIVIIDQVGEETFAQIKDGMMLEIRDNKIYTKNKLIGQGVLLTKQIVDAKLAEAKNNYSGELEKFIHNTIEYASKELKIIGSDLKLPQIKADFAGKHTLIVVRGKDYKEDLHTIRSYIEEMKPVLIGVDGGADALREFGYCPDLIIGDMDSISDSTLKCGAQLLVHAYPNGKAPGMTRINALKLRASTISAAGTSEDVALLLAYQMGTELIVAVGTHSNMIEFLEKGRPGMASTFLTRLKVGSILIDAKGVSKLYRQSMKYRYLVELVVAAFIPLIVVSMVSPSTFQFLRLLVIKLRLLFQFY